MNASENHQLKVKKFDGKEFGFWKSKVTNHLMFLGLDGNLTVKPDNTVAAAVTADKKALAFVKECLSDKLYCRYDKEPTTKELWDKLKTDFETMDAQSLFVLRNKFLFAIKNRSESMSDYVNHLYSIKQELKDAGSEPSEKDFILTIMNGTHAEYGNYVSAMTGKKKVDELTSTELISQLIQEDDLRSTMRNQREVNSTDRRVFTVKQNAIKNDKKAKKLGKCYNCGKIGHFANVCRNPKTEQRKTTREYACHATEKKVRFEERVCIVGEASEERNKWLLDSGASTHVCNSRSMFEEIKPEKSSVLVGDNNEVFVEGRGTVKLRVKANNTNIVNALILQNVAFVPKLGVNLVSTGRLESQGMTIVTENGRSNILAGSTLIGCAVRTKRNPYLYEFEYQQRDTVLLTTTMNRWSLWHQRLGHLSDDYMNKLIPENAELKHGKPFCEDCHLCKAKKLPHKEKPQKCVDEEKRTGTRKGVIHSDLMGPIKNTSLGGCRYVLTYICAQTEYSYVYLLKNKSEQFEYFKIFKAMYENQSRFKIRTLRSDNGLEYFSNEFQQYLREKGIQHMTSVAYVPQSNGKAERLNRTLLEKARSMLTTAKLDLYMWGSAILTANYLRNMSPCRAINFKTPFELMFNRPPSLKHLKIFGCRAYPLIVNKKRDKFEPTAQEHCVMAGYDDKVGIYWIYNKSKRTLFRSRDVTFNEEMAVQDETQLDQLAKDSEEWLSISSEIFSNEEENPSVEARVEAVVEPEAEPAVDSEEETDEENIDQGGDSIEIDHNSLQPPVPAPRRSSRESKIPERLEVDPTKKVYLFNDLESIEGELDDPQTIKAALNGPNKENWKKAIQSELESIKENDVWTVVERSSDKKIIGTRWVFKVKRNSNNEPEKFKARLVAKGYNQKYGVDYFETFAPVVKVQTLRTLLAIAANLELHVHQIDINTAFLNGTLEEEVYVEPPPGTNICQPNQVLKLKRSLYGLKQSPRAWNATLVKFLNKFGLTQIKSDSCVFVNKYIMLAIYVDDIIILSKQLEKIVEFKKAISEKFKTKDLGKVNYVLKIKVEEIPGGGLKLHQHNYIDDLIKLYGLNNEKTVDLPIQPNHRLTLDLTDEPDELKASVDETKYRQAIGKLMYLMVCTRPDISYAVSILSRFMSAPKEKHWRCVKLLLKYIKSTRNYSLIYPKLNTTVITGYSDSDHAGDFDDRKSTSGFIFCLGKCTISWKSTKQKSFHKQHKKLFGSSSS